MFSTTHSLPFAIFVTSLLSTSLTKNLRRSCAIFLLIFLAALTAQAQSTGSDWTWIGGGSTVPVAGGNPGVYGTLGTPAPTNIPGGRADHAVSWTDSNGNFWLFGGWGFDVNGTNGSLNDLWTYSPSSNEWTWIGGSSTVPVLYGGNPGVYGTLYTPATTNIPGSREWATSWTDSSGHLWLFGGSGYDANDINGSLNDLWEYFPATNEWAWISGSTTLPSIYFGRPGVYGIEGSPSLTNTPGGRAGAAAWTDANNNLWLFGGDGYDVNGNPGDLNDLWEFNTTTNEWTWQGGSETVSQPGLYGALGTPSTANIPGSRVGAISWTDSTGNQWLFGGNGLDINSSSGYLNDLWQFNSTTLAWTWITGSDTVNQAGIYGTQGTPAATNIPGARYYAANWADNNGNLWLFGSAGLDANGATQDLNDLWEYTPSTNQWTWVSGGNIGTNPGVYGTLGTPAATNTPGGRGGDNNWIDSAGNLWLFGGGGYDANGNFGDLNDLWEFQPAISTTTTLTSSLNPSTYGAAVTFTASVVPATGSNTPTGTVQFFINGLPVGAAVTLVNGDAAYTTSTLAVGTYTVVAVYTPTGVFTPSTSNTITQIVDQASQTINFPAIGNQYLGVAPFALNATASSGLTVTYTVSSGPATISGNVITLTGLGTVTVIATQVGNSSYLAAPPVQQSFNVIQPTITWTPPASIIYGTTFGSLMTATIPVPGTFAYSDDAGPLNSSSVLTVAVYQLTVVFTPTYAGNQLKAGPRLIVAPATLTVTPQNVSLPYSSQVPVFAYTITGFVNGDSPSVVTGGPTIDTTATQRATKTYGVVLFTSPVGTYTITTTWGSLKAANYTFSFQTATLTITQSSQYITVTANNLSVAYGSPIPTLTYKMTGFLGWDTQSSQTTGQPGLSTTAVQGSPRGTYPITIVDGNLTQIYNNYAGFIFVNGTLTIH
jgi:N-acetylneuraminic acid mutarotase